VAIRPVEAYPSQTYPGDPAYPHGKAQNVDVPGANNGTPLEAAWLNDLWGFQQALLAEAQITPSDQPDEVGKSDYLAALKILATRAAEDLPNRANTWSAEQYFDQKVVVGAGVENGVPPIPRLLLPLSSALLSAYGFLGGGLISFKGYAQFPIRLMTGNSFTEVRVACQASINSPLKARIVQLTPNKTLATTATRVVLPLLSSGSEVVSALGSPPAILSLATAETVVVDNTKNEYFLELENSADETQSPASIYWADVRAPQRYLRAY
jgi:hypothetical protein